MAISEVVQHRALMYPMVDVDRSLPERMAYVAGGTELRRTVAAQRLFRTGHDLRGVDRHDLAFLDELDGGRSRGVVNAP